MLIEQRKSFRSKLMYHKAQNFKLRLLDSLIKNETDMGYYRLILKHEYRIGDQIKEDFTEGTVSIRTIENVVTRIDSMVFENTYTKPTFLKSQIWT